MTLSSLQKKRKHGGRMALKLECGEDQNPVHQRKGRHALLFTKLPLAFNRTPRPQSYQLAISWNKRKHTTKFHLQYPMPVCKKHQRTGRTWMLLRTADVLATGAHQRSSFCARAFHSSNLQCSDQPAIDSMPCNDAR